MLRLGPIAGHTTHDSVLLWIRGTRQAADYTVIVNGVGRFRFGRTGPGADLYGTAIVRIDGLKPDRLYQYRILERGRACAGGRGQVRTAPRPGDWRPQMVLYASCSDNTARGAWDEFIAFAKDLEPRAVFFIGDQVYQDDPRPGTDHGLWNDYVDGRVKAGEALRLKMAETYQHCWSRPGIREVMKLCPIYTIWDDHEIRDGWGSWACDSPTMAARTPAAAKLCAEDSAYYDAARDVAWHFQMCRNPNAYPRAGKGGAAATTVEFTPLGGFASQRTAFGYAVEIGRAAYVVVDGRGDRDLWREGTKVLSAAQWDCLDAYVDNLDPDIDAVTFITGVPIAAMGPDWLVQNAYKGREEDIDPVLTGDRARMRALQKADKSTGQYVIAAGVAAGLVLLAPAMPGFPALATTLAGHASHFRQADLDDVRDQWAHAISRPEQARLIRLAASARLTNRTSIYPRSVMFVGGDLHAGAQITLDVEGAKLRTLITSGIGKKLGALEAFLVTQKAFTVAPGITATRTQLINIYNFGMVTMDPSQAGGRFSISLVTPTGLDGSEFYFGGYAVTGDPVPESFRRLMDPPLGRAPRRDTRPDSSPF